MCGFQRSVSARLRFPCQDFLEEILKAYNIEMHHLTPNGIAKIALFIRAVKSQGVNLDIKAFCALHESIHNFGVSMCLHQNLGERTRELAGFQGCASQERSMLADSNTTLESDIY